MSARRGGRWALWVILVSLPLLLGLPLLVIAYGAMTAPRAGGERLQDLIGVAGLVVIMALFYVLVARGRRGDRGS